MSGVTEFLAGFPELAVFGTIAVGYLLGSIRIGDFSLGPVAGSLFAGLVIGQLAEIPVAGMAKSYLFLLFLFGIGYSAGPQFLQALRRTGIQPILLATVVATTGLLAAFAMARLMQLDPGFSGGLFAGAVTQSSAIGSASEAVTLLGLGAEETEKLTAHVAVGYAICYVVGYTVAIWFCSYLGPKLLRINLKDEAAALAESLGIEDENPNIVSGYRQFQFRAYRTPPESRIIGRLLAEVEREVADRRLFVLRLRRDGEILEAAPDLRFEAGDVLAISGRQENVIEVLSKSAEEVDDAALLDIPYRQARIVVTNRDVLERDLRDLGVTDWARGVYLRTILRGESRIPVAPGIRLQAGDVIDLIGPATMLDRASAHFGRELSPTPATDFVVLGLMIFFGGLLGTLLRFSILGVEVTLGTSVGVLLAGLLTGYLSSRFPFFGRIPNGAVTLMTTFGLASFIAMVGLQAAPQLAPAIEEVGVMLPIGGFIVAILPLFAGLAFGHFVLRMNPVLLLGGIAGSQTATAAMAAVQTRADSPLPVLGYAPTYPVAQVLATLWGSVIVILMA
ncbi:putative transport protein [Aliiruegeria haliotis]|uniref:Putative transport protein n=1 Tax=Aliiruegeria haliotis TaxID=1280846 RepID=A0A2T0REW6_9RHOB|nr:TrkA C-terminal domain-containing protein [Aliiruegeria haliotis]PRY19682.1 putative transport protein [Aliiruegeria haliotis]